MAIWLGKNLLGQKDNSGAVRLPMAPITNAQDLDSAAETVTQAIGGGMIEPAAGQVMMNVLEARGRIIETTLFEGRLRKLEDQAGLQRVA